MSRKPRGHLQPPALYSGTTQSRPNPIALVQCSAPQHTATPSRRSRCNTYQPLRATTPFAPNHPAFQALGNFPGLGSLWYQVPVKDDWNYLTVQPTSEDSRTWPTIFGLDLCLTPNLTGQAETIVGSPPFSGHQVILSSSESRTNKPTTDERLRQAYPIHLQAATLQHTATPLANLSLALFATRCRSWACNASSRQQFDRT